MSKLCKRVFIANRGEIARRIALTAGRLGIQSVALTDRPVPPQYLADCVSRFVRVREESPALYLNAEAMIRHALDSGCDALHPGFGFLSENAEFARKCLEAGLQWVGPCPEAIDAMASKAVARRWAQKSGLPMVRGLSDFPVPDNESGDFSQLESFARETGYPLLIKAALGGGGKGMRLVRSAGELKSAVLRARSEAVNSFGDGNLLVEQYIEAPRHVEVQILADRKGNVMAIGDRDCSVQRRHQKIIEEAPAPGLTDETRAAMHKAAVNLAKSVGYDSAGTVEFLLDWSPQSRDAKLQKFYFLEMNTRLQVEHPVTEEVFGIDLVEWQFRVAADIALTPEVLSAKSRGHSIEVRIYAEDPLNGFFPAPGPVACFRPASGPGIRWEQGLDERDEITGRFDPMIAKLIATGATRTVALDRLLQAMRRTVFAGPENNLMYLDVIAGSSSFAHEPVTTHFLEDGHDQLIKQIRERTTARQALLEQALARHEGTVPGGLTPAAGTGGHFADILTNSIFSSNNRSVSLAGAEGSSSKILEVTTSAGPSGSAPGLYVSETIPGDDGIHLTIWYASTSTPETTLSWAGCDGVVLRRSASRARRSHGGAAAAGAGGSGAVTAPVPGKVISIRVEQGTLVEAGDQLLILESMKMEFEVRVQVSGAVGSIKVRQGEQVTAGQLLAEVVQEEK